MILPIQLSDSRMVVFFAVAILSAIISLYAYFSIDVINNDGILYIETAEAYLAGGFSDAMAVFSWPFFSVTIAWFHQLTGVPLEASAHAVNAIMLIIVSLIFLRIYEEISTGFSSLWIPALVVLALPLVNEYREEIIRGPGYWAFSMLAILFFIINYKKSTCSSALLWQICAIIGVLFRIEGVVFLLGAPYIFLFFKEKRKAFLYHYLRLNSIVILVAACSAAILIFHHIRLEDPSGALQLRLSYMVPASLLANVISISTEIGTIMPRLSTGEAVLVSVSGLVVLVVYKLVKGNLIYLSLIVVGNHKRWFKLSQESKIVLLFFVISILPVITIAGNQYFVSSRFTVLSSILFALIASQYAAYMFYKLSGNGQIKTISLSVAVIIVFFLDAIIHSSGVKGNIVTASEWVLKYIKPDAKILCNNKRFYFYTKKRCAYSDFAEKHATDGLENALNKGRYSYMLLWVEDGDKKMRKLLEEDERFELLEAFNNKRNDEARVYKIRSYQ